MELECFQLPSKAKARWSRIQLLFLSHGKPFKQLYQKKKINLPKINWKGLHEDMELRQWSNSNMNSDKKNWNNRYSTSSLNKDNMCNCVNHDHKNYWMWGNMPYFPLSWWINSKLTPPPQKHRATSFPCGGSKQFAVLMIRCAITSTLNRPMTKQEHQTNVQSLVNKCLFLRVSLYQSQSHH